MLPNRLKPEWCPDINADISSLHKGYIHYVYAILSVLLYVLTVTGKISTESQLLLYHSLSPKKLWRVYFSTVKFYI